MKIGFVTCNALKNYFPSHNPLFTHDDYAAAQFLDEQNITVVPVLWGMSAEAIRAQGITALIMRSPWDYTYTADNTERFYAWIKAIAQNGLAMFNAPALMLWNLNKRYLHHLSVHGAQIVPTTFIEPDDTVDFLALLKTHGPFVLKPAIGAGAKDLFRITTAADINHNQLASLRKNRTFLVQPFLRDVTTHGEWSLVYFAGKYSHAVQKRPATGQWLVQDELGGSVASAEPSPSVIHAADRAMHALARAYETSNEQPYVLPLYARVDLLSNNGDHFVSELELVEPELFFLERLASKSVPNLNALARFHESLLRALSS